MKKIFRVLLYLLGLIVFGGLIYLAIILIDVPPTVL
jgi:hypothetical protein